MCLLRLIKAAITAEQLFHLFKFQKFERKKYLNTERIFFSRQEVNKCFYVNRHMEMEELLFDKQERLLELPRAVHVRKLLLGQAFSRAV